MWSINARGAALSAGLCAAALAACAGPGAPQIADARLPTEQYAVKVADVPERVAVSIHAAGLSPRQKAALQTFAQRWRDARAGVVVVESPMNSAVEADPRAAANAVAAALVRLGVPAAQLRLAEYDAGGQPGAPVVARYSTLQAIAPDCSGPWGNLVATNDNRVTSRFGCATTANFAAQLADARDLVQPAQAEPSDGVRRAFVLDKYRQGQVTSSQKDDQASGTVSNAVRN
jgi:pilus assembly protein CpaD